MKSFLSKIIGFVTSFFSKDFAPGVIKALTAVSPYVMKAYPIVKVIAEITPTRLDDQIIAAYEKYGLGHLFNPGIPKDLALRELAKALLKKDIPEGVTVQDYILNTAIELAYAKFKEELLEAKTAKVVEIKPVS